MVMRRKGDTSDVPTGGRQETRRSSFRHLPLINSVLIVAVCGQLLYGAFSERQASREADMRQETRILQILDGRTAERKVNERAQQAEIDKVQAKALADQRAFNWAVCRYLPSLPANQERTVLERRLQCP